MKKAIAAAIILCVCASLAFWWGGREPVVTPAANRGADSPAVAQQPAGNLPSASVKAAPSVQPAQNMLAQPAVPPPQPASVPVTQTAPPPPRPPPPQDEPARQEADSIALNIRHFGQRFGGNPVGTNAEIVKTLTGDNQARAKYLAGDLLRLNDKGELIDQWGTPYFFHQNSSTSMEVRSAGPDQTLHTRDDVIAR